MTTKAAHRPLGSNGTRGSAWETFLSQDYVTHSILFTLPGGLIVSLVVVLLTLVISKRATKTKGEAPKPTATAQAKKRLGAVCPFSAETDFVVELAEGMAPTPLAMYESWTDPGSVDYGKPLGARWLNAGLSGQDTPGMLRAGLKRLPDAKFFLVEESFRMREELLMKHKALDDPDRYPKVFVAEKDSLPAQREVLDLFLSYLPRRYPDLYSYDPATDSLYVSPVDTTFIVNEWRPNRPLELCERIVQEDLILMRPPCISGSSSSSSSKGTKDDGPSQFEMAAAAVIFSFNELQAKLGKPVRFIHAPVPGYERHLRRSLDLTFSKLLKVEQPMWRNNWGISPSGSLDEPLYGSTDAHHHRMMTAVTVDEIKAKFLKVEYQTIRRLPRTGYLLFTVKTMADPIHALEEVPPAARCLAASIRGMSPDMRRYKGIENDATCEAVLAYLDSIGREAEAEKQS